MTAADAYRKTAMETSDAGDIVVALYDGFIKNCHIAKEAFNNGERARAGEAMSDAMAIVGELHASLDPEAGDEEFAQRLSGIYTFVSDTMLDISIENDPEPLDELIELMTDLRDAWREAADEVREGQHSKIAG